LRDEAGGPVEGHEKKHDKGSDQRASDRRSIPAILRTPDDGRSDPVPGPDHASISPNGRLLTVYTNGGNGVKILDVALITEIEVTEASI